MIFTALVASVFICLPLIYRLEDDLDVVEEDIKNKEPNEPRLVFTNGIKKNLTPEPILPEAVINQM